MNVTIEATAAGTRLRSYDPAMVSTIRNWVAPTLVAIRKTTGAVVSIFTYLTANGSVSISAVAPDDTIITRLGAFA